MGAMALNPPPDARTKSLNPAPRRFARPDAASHLSPRRRFSAGHVRMGRFNRSRWGGDPQRVSQRFSISESACGLTPIVLATAALMSPRLDRVGGTGRCVRAPRRGEVFR
jgi:hypothetical protein